MPDTPDQPLQIGQLTPSEREAWGQIIRSSQTIQVSQEANNGDKTMANVALILGLVEQYGPTIGKAAVSLLGKDAFPPETDWESFFKLFDKPAEAYMPPKV